MDEEEFFERKHTSEYVGIKEFRKSNNLYEVLNV